MLGLTVSADTYPISVLAKAIPLTSSYTQDFNTLKTSGSTNTSLPDGWQAAEFGTASNRNAYGASNGSHSASDVYSYGAFSSSERALGSLGDNTTNRGTFGALFKNTTGTSITSLSISYTGEQYRLGSTNRADRLDFQLSLTATSVSNSKTSFSSVEADTAFEPIDSLDFSSPVTTGALGERFATVDVSALLTDLNIAPNGTFFLRWLDTDASGTDDGLAVDDFTIEANPTPAATPLPGPLVGGVILLGLHATRRHRDSSLK